MSGISKTPVSPPCEEIDVRVKAFCDRGAASYSYACVDYDCDCDGRKVGPDAIGNLGGKPLLGLLQTIRDTPF